MTTERQPYIIRWFRALSPAEGQAMLERDGPEYARAGYVPLVERWISLGELGVYTWIGVVSSWPLQTGGVLIVTLSYRPDLTGEPVVELGELQLDPSYGPSWK